MFAICLLPATTFIAAIIINRFKEPNKGTTNFFLHAMVGIKFFFLIFVA